METKKRNYEPLRVEALALACDRSILAASVVPTGSKVDNVGQDIGKMYLFSTENGIDENTGKTFSHEWETGKDE